MQSNCLGILAFFGVVATLAFQIGAYSAVPPAGIRTLAQRSSSTNLFMAPKFDKSSERWVPSRPEESSEAGYDIWGTLVRHGPEPFFKRVFEADTYDQAVLKFMAMDKIDDRNVGQAEMDAFFRNQNDWLYYRVNNVPVDYLKIDKKQIILTITWGLTSTAIIGRAIYCVITGESFNAIFH